MLSLGIGVRDGATEGLRALAGRAAALHDAFDEIGGAVVASTQQRFLDEEAPDGSSWPGHSEATIAMRGDGAEVLRDRGDLFDSLSHQPEDDRVLVGPNRVYARIHQEGGMAGRGRKVRIPARAYLGLSDQDVGEVRTIVTTHLRGDL